MTFSENYSKNHTLIHSRIDHLNVFTFLLGLLMTSVLVDSRLTVFTNFRTTYPKVLFTRNAGTDQPPPSDPALVSPAARFRICEDLSRSGVFAALGMNPLNIVEMYEELQQPRYSHLFARIFVNGERRGREVVRYRYLNPYRLLEIETYERSETGQRIRTVWKAEYMFFCVLKIGTHSEDHLVEPDEKNIFSQLEHGENLTPKHATTSGSDEMVDEMDEDEADLRRHEETVGHNDVHGSDSEETVSEYRMDESGRSDSEETVSEYRIGGGTDTEGSFSEDESLNLNVGDIVTLYVSKLYDAHRGLHAYRFVLVEIKSMPDTFAAVLMAAESARVYVRPDFNVELHYLELRKHHLPARNCQEDPVCKLILMERHQLFQLCTKVLTASYFRDHVQYPSRTPSRLQYDFWSKEQVFFRTGLGLSEAAGTIYEEYVLPCYADTTDDDAGRVFYITRGYNPYHVFLLTIDPTNYRFYLENLVIDMFPMNSFENRLRINFLANTVNVFLLILSVDGRYTVFSNFNSMYPKNLYIRAGTSDQPSLLLDPATFDVSTRRRLCEEISQSGVFAVYGMHPVDMDEVYEDLQQPRYSSIFRLIYGMRKFRNEQNRYEYTNRYERREMEVGQYVSTRAGVELRAVRRYEYMFLCLLEIEEFAESEGTDTGDADTEEDVDKGDSAEVLKSRHSDSEESPTTEGTYEVELTPFFVSKLYEAHRGLHSYRFIFLERLDTYVRGHVVMMLAAESTRAHVRPDFNVELHYVELRKHHRPARNCRHDPVCKLKFENLHNERLFHLCTSVLASSQFADRVQYPSRISFITTQDFWYTERVFFRTKEGLENAASELYDEFVLPCHADTANGEEVFYISRAYNPYQVFVFTRDPANDQLYLESLLTNVSPVHERYNFGNVEI